MVKKWRYDSWIAYKEIVSRLGLVIKSHIVQEKLRPGKVSARIQEVLIAKTELLHLSTFSFHNLSFHVSEPISSIVFSTCFVFMFF